MQPDVILDTSVLIRHLRWTTGQDPLTHWLAERGFSIPGISIVTWFEYDLGERMAERKPSFKSVFPDLHILPTNDAVWSRASRIQNHSIAHNAQMGLADLLIAATAYHQDIPLLTLNVRHFAHLQSRPFLLRLPKAP